MWPDKTFMFRLSWALLFGVLTANFLASQAKADNPLSRLSTLPVIVNTQKEHRDNNA